MKRGKRKQKETLADDHCLEEVRSREAAAKLDMAGLADHMKDVLGIASPTADHAELREVVAVLETLRDEGIRDLEGLKDYIFDYELANKQIAAMREKYEKRERVIKRFDMFYCPVCHTRVYHWMKHCGKCGKAISTS